MPKDDAAQNGDAPVPPDRPSGGDDTAGVEAIVAMASSPLASASGLGKALDAHRDSVSMAIRPPPPPAVAVPSVAAAAEPIELSAYNPTWKHEVTLYAPFHGLWGPPAHSSRL